MYGRTPLVGSPIIGGYKFSIVAVYQIATIQNCVPMRLLIANETISTHHHYLRKLVINEAAHQCLVKTSRQSVELKLTLLEFNLLSTLVTHEGICMTRDQLLNKVWGMDFSPGTNSVDVAIYSLRKKLRYVGLARTIQTIRGVGYRYDPSISFQSNVPMKF